MLVLSRKLDQVIEIGPEIRVTVVELRGNKVRLGIDAPRHLRVVRRDGRRRSVCGCGGLCDSGHPCPMPKAG